MNTLQNIGSEGIKDIIAKQFPVCSKERLVGPNGVESPFYAMYRQDSNGCPVQCVSPAVSKQYVEHTRDDVATIGEAFGVAFEGGVADVQTSFNNGHKICVAPSKDYQRAIFNDKDHVFPRGIVDCTFGTSFHVSLGMLRNVCSNLQIPQVVGNASFDVKIRHTSKLRSHFDQLVDDLAHLKDGWDALIAHMNNLKECKVDLEAFMDKLYDPSKFESKSAATRHDSRTRLIIQRLQRERLQLGIEDRNLETVNGYELYQAIQGYCQHDKTRRGHADGDKFTRATLAFNDSDIKRAQNLIFELAA